MKNLLVKKIDIDTNSSIDQISEKLNNFSENLIENVNWEKEFPYKPNVKFKIAHNNKNIFIKYFVEENSIRGVNTKNNGSVWEDSCCEFFLSFDNKNYYNLETNCIGTKLLGYGNSNTNRVHATDSIIDNITSKSTLGDSLIENKDGKFTWELTLAIPVTSFFNDKITELSNTKHRVNIYKCGDKTSNVHFLSWNKIDLESPNFHCPEFFGTIEFQ